MDNFIGICGYLEQKASRENMFEYKLPTLSSQIMTLIKKYERLTISELETLTKANRNTIKKHLASLVKTQLITKHGQRKTTWYTL